MIGTLGDVVFEVSEDRVRTFIELSRSGAARLHEHMVVSQKPRLEFLGPDIDSIILPMRFDVAQGINPIVEINALRDYRDQGQRLALVIGGKFLGDFAIERITETWERMDNRGNLLVASISVNLLESEPG